MRSGDGAEAAKPKAEAKVNVEEAKWGDDDDSLGSLDDEIGAQGSKPAADGEEVAAVEEESDIFVPPQPGADPYQAALRMNPTNAALNVAAGDFQKAMELLRSQISVGNFAPLKQLFVDTLTLSRVKMQALPHGPQTDMQLKTSATVPLLPVSIRSLEDKMAKGIDLTTKGDFVASLATFRELIQSVPLIAVASAQEANRVKAILK